MLKTPLLVTRELFDCINSPYLFQVHISLVWFEICMLDASSLGDLTMPEAAAGYTEPLVLKNLKRAKAQTMVRFSLGSRFQKDLSNKNTLGAA